MKGSRTAEASAPCPIVFLLGPPGVGKSTLGRAACTELGLGFIDVSAMPAALSAGGDYRSDLARFSRIVADRAADVVELPWQLQHQRDALVLACRSGVPLLLWAHPEEMQARSGRDEPMFTPVPRLKIRGGFGRNGTACREFRRLHRACGRTVLLVGLPLETAAETVKGCIAGIREQSDASQAEREGLAGWQESWCHEHGVSPRVARVIVDAMARYLSYLRAGGSSARTLSSVRSDLSAAGHLVLMYDAPKGGRILKHFDGPPWTLEFKRMFTDSRTLVARYRRSLEGFARFLKECEEPPRDGVLRVR